MSKRLWPLLLVAVGVSLGLVQAYSVAPRTGNWSGWTSLTAPNNRVSQTVTCNFDSLVYVELFAGDEGSGGQYRVGVWQDGIEVMFATQFPRQSCDWVRFDSWDVHPAFTKGKLLEFRFTRSGQDC
jgi:hypothetical protein